MVEIELVEGIRSWARGYPGYQRIPFDHIPHGHVVRVPSVFWAEEIFLTLRIIHLPSLSLLGTEVFC